MTVNVRILAKIKQHFLPPVAKLLCCFNRLQHSLFAVLFFFSVAVYYQVVVMSCLRDEFLFQIIGFLLESDFVNKKHAKLWKNPFEIN